MHLRETYHSIRRATQDLCAPLTTEDHVPQAAPFVSPAKWHLGHTTWFFEEFLLRPHKQDYAVFDPSFGYVLNSYYQSMGERVPRSSRGLVTRPTVSRTKDYRQYVDAAMDSLILRAIERGDDKLLQTVILGLHHEQQHQELLITDIKYLLFQNPLLPTYHPDFDKTGPKATKEIANEWLPISEGTYEIGVSGHPNNDVFCYDNETPRHKVFVQNFAIASRLISNAEYQQFIDAGGYQNPDLWLDDGWSWKQKNEIECPLYWNKVQGAWHQFTLAGNLPITKDAPVTHVSYYEAAAFAEFAGKVLPTESQWEVASNLFSWGQRWEWTASAYLPYPGYQKPVGALGEYNGKFMVGQMVLRGASTATPHNHSRNTYRNFFYPHDRWQYTGIRLATYNNKQ